MLVFIFIYFFRCTRHVSFLESQVSVCHFRLPERALAQSLLSSLMESCYTMQQRSYENVSSDLDGLMATHDLSPFSATTRLHNH